MAQVEKMTENQLQEGQLQLGQRKEDRRTRYTKMVLHDAFFEILREKGFEKMSVTDLCKRAEINRGTFYLHYVDKYALLDEVIDAALDVENPLDDGPAAPMCQRTPSNEDHRLLYTLPELSGRVVERVIERGAETAIPTIMERTGLSEHDAHTLFVFVANGNMAVNRLLGWQRNDEYLRAQEVIGAFTESGYRGVV